MKEIQHEGKIQPGKYHRHVQLPLKEFDKCFVCRGSSNLMLCFACSEAAFCSADCQMRGWKKHKVTCGGAGNTIKLDLDNFYPFLALLADYKHNKHILAREDHPGVTHTILKGPDSVPPIQNPDGTTTKLVVLGDKLRDKGDLGTPKWWPTAPSDDARLELFRRISRNSNPVLMLVPVVTALLASVYTTKYIPANKTPDGKVRKRIRLHYRGSPIKDFGLAVGSVRLPNDSELAFQSPSGEITKHQNPQNHCWIYFRTLRGEECILDCSLFPYGLEFMVGCDGYGGEGDTFFTETSPAAGLFLGAEMKNCPIRYEARRYFTALRSQWLTEAVVYSEFGIRPEDSARIHSWAAAIAGQRFPEKELHLLMNWVAKDLQLFSGLLSRANWGQWPKIPRVDFHNSNVKDNRSIGEFLVKWNVKYKRGQITYEEWTAGCRCWRLKEGERDDASDEI